MAADSKARLEDIYLPYKPRRRTKAQVAREAGLEPLADQLLASPDTVPEQAAADYVDAGRGVADVAAALDGARAILAERFAEDADLIGELREQMWSRGRLVSRVREGRGGGREVRRLLRVRGGVHRAALAPDPGHDARGERRNPRSHDGPGRAPRLTAWRLPRRPITQRKSPGVIDIADRGRPADRSLGDTVQWAWRTRIVVHLGVDLRMRLWQRAEDEAVTVFAANLRDLLLAAPAGTRATMGLDPGFRTGVKVAVVDGTGKSVATDTIYPHELRRGGAGAPARRSGRSPSPRWPGWPPPIGWS